MLDDFIDLKPDEQGELRVPYDERNIEHPPELVARHMLATVTSMTGLQFNGRDQSSLWKKFLPAADELLRRLEQNRRPRQMHYEDHARWVRTGQTRFRFGGFFTRTMVLQVHESRMGYDLIRWPDPPPAELRRMYRWRDATVKEALNLDSQLLLDPNFMMD